MLKRQTARPKPSVTSSPVSSDIRKALGGIKDPQAGKELPSGYVLYEATMSKSEC